MKAWLLAALLAGGAAAEPVESSGENPGRPVRRFDLRVRARELGDQSWQTQLTLRADTVHYREDWTVYTRFDLPVGQGGLGDTLLQVYAATPKDRVQGLFGLRLTAPTSGSTSWTVAPQLGVVCNVPEISPGTFFGLVAWNTSDFAGSVNQLTLKPLLHFELGDGLYVQSQPELQHDNRTGRWFIPLDLMVGKMVSEDVVVSLQYQRSLSGYQPNFYQSFELRTGFFY